MRLHEDTPAFQALLSSVSMRSGIREDIIEKDYYLTMLLDELSAKQLEIKAYFKGGTALYKAIGRMIRFSEDIDLTVESHDCSRSQAKKRLEQSANGYTVLPRTDKKELEENRRGSITSVYSYRPVTVVDQDDALQRFGNVKVEATSFTVSEPVESLTIAPLLYRQATEAEQMILAEQYDVHPFQVATIKLERIFADKILAAEFYYERDMLFDVSKHLFDLSVMMNMERIQQLLSEPDKMVEMLAYKRREEIVRTGSDLAYKPFSQFCLFAELSRNGKLEEAFAKMQRIYVFDEKDILSYHDMSGRITTLGATLLTLNENLKMSELEPPSFSITM